MIIWQQPINKSFDHPDKVIAALYEYGIHGTLQHDGAWKNHVAIDIPKHHGVRALQMIERRFGRRQWGE